MKQKTGKKVWKVVWTDQAKSAIKGIYLFYKDKSPQGARKVRDELLDSPKHVVFAAQYQEDDINPRYRRIIVRHFKVLYRVDKDIIQVLDVISSLRSPEILRDKSDGDHS